MIVVYFSLGAWCVSLLNKCYYSASELVLGKTDVCFEPGHYSRWLILIRQILIELVVVCASTTKKIVVQQQELANFIYTAISISKMGYFNCKLQANWCCKIVLMLNGPNHLLLAMLQIFDWQHCKWHCLQKLFCLKLPNSVRNAKKFLEAMPLAMLPTKSLQHCQDQMIRANVCHGIEKFSLLVFVLWIYSFPNKCCIYR